MAAWDNVEGFEFQHDLITPSLDRQAACLSLPMFDPKKGEVRLRQVLVTKLETFR